MMPAHPTRSPPVVPESPTADGVDRVDTAADEALAERFRAGDDEAFAVLYARWRPRAVSYALKIVHTPAVAEEIATDAFVTLVEGRFSPKAREGSFRAWLFTVVQRRCLDTLRRRGTRGRVLPLLREEPTPPALEAAIDGLRDKARLEAALESLPVEHRSVVLLYYAQGLSSREVAEATEQTDQQVRSKLSYARRVLRRTLAQESP